jgi:hypothetical protein
MLLGLLWPTLGWLLGLVYHGLVAALGFLGHRRTGSRGWMLIGFGGAIAFLGTLPGVLPFLTMFLGGMGDYLGLLAIAVGILGILNIAGGVLIALGLFTLYKEHKERFPKAP